MIKKWQNSLSEKYSSAYVNKIYTTFRISLDLAVQLNLLKENVARKVKNVKEVNKEVDFWTLDEFKRVISSFTQEFIRFVRFKPFTFILAKLPTLYVFFIMHSKVSIFNVAFDY